MLRTLALGMLVSFPLVSLAQSITMPVDDLKKEQNGAVQPAPSLAAPSVQLSPTTPAPDQKKYDERVEVTGSHIRKIDVEGASPILTVNRKDIEKTNYNSVSDIMRDTTVSAFGSARESSGSNAAGVASIDLRGLGADNTLVLLNGQRLPTDAVTGYVDINLIPTAAVERVDVLKDGSSAVYGSDALAGVVNMITRKDFNGSEVTMSQTTPEYKGGKRQDISLVNGVSKGKFSMVNVVQYRNNEVVYSRDRKFSNTALSPTGNPGSYSQNGGTSYADPNCPANLIHHTPDGDECRINTGDFSTQLPALQQVSLFHDNTLNVGSRLKFNTRLMGTRKTVQWQYAPQPGQFTIPAAVAATLGPNGGPMPNTDPTQDLDVSYRTLGLGNRESHITTTGFNALEDVGVELGKGWSLDVIGSHNIVRTKDNGVNGYVLGAKLKDAIATGRINPFRTTGNDFSGLQYTTTHDTEAQYSAGEIKASGPILEMPAGDLSVAVGADVGYARYQDSIDDASLNKQVLSNTGSNGKGSRDTRSAFAEVSVPITKKLDLSLAERYDRFSDFGESVNPKASVAYRPAKSLLMRASAGTGFKAPLMQSLYGSANQSAEWIIDQVSCDREKAKGAAGDLTQCQPQQHTVFSGGNRNLKPEHSVAFNAGTVFQPNKDVAMGFDLFHMRIKDVVGIDYDDAIRAEAQFGKQYMLDHGVNIHRNAGGFIDKQLGIDAPLLNLSKQEITGIDLQAEYRISKIKLNMAHSQMFYFKQEGFPGMGLRNQLGDSGKPRWRNVAAVSYLPNERHDLTLSANTIAGQRKLDKEQGGSTNNYTTMDLEYSYAWKKVGVFSLGVKNLLDSNPPLDDTQPATPLNVALYDQIGRAFYTGYKATF